jgi:4-hydroxy-2-oxoglutarate aldolase
MNVKLEGIYAPVPTPYDPGGSEEICLEAFQSNMSKWAASSIDGIVVCGSNGELPFITVDERARLTASARDALRQHGSDKKIITGAFMHSTRETAACCRAAADAGADAVLVLPPHYFKASGMRGATSYFESVADASPIPVVLYNMPGNTGVDMDAGAVIHLARHPNIIGIKDTSGDMTKLGTMMSAQGDGFSVFCGSANYFLPALSLGATGGTLAAANLYPEFCRKLVETYRSSRYDEARAMQQRLLPVSDALTRRFGIPGLKAALDRAGLYGGPCRRPLLPLDGDSKMELFKILDESGLDSYETWRNQTPANP